MTAGADRPMYDVAIVGAGLGGVSAALRVAEAGASVVLVEVGDELGGTAVFSGGGIHIWGAQSWEEYREHCPLAEPNLARTLFDGFQPYVDWLVSTGAPGYFATTTLRGLTLSKYQIGDSIAPRGKIRWFRYLGKRIASLGGTVLTGARATGLSRLPSGDMSIEVALDGRVTELHARTVILAAGGFQSSPRLLGEHIGPGASAFVNRSVRHDVGDGLELAVSMGAASTASMETLYGHLMPAPPCRIGWSNYVDPILLSAFYAQHAVLLNARGERFVDEGVGELNGETINASAQQPPTGLWIVLDAEIRRRHVRYELPRNVLRPKNLRYAWLLRYMGLRREEGRVEVVMDSLGFARKRGATVVEAATLEDLGDRLQERGVDGRRAVETVREYSARAREGTAAELAVAKTKHALPIDTAPFYAIEVAVGVSMTYGGVAIDERARALDGDGTPITGLYAVPGTAGVHRLHYGGALAACGVYGMIAADGAVKQAVQARGGG